MSAAGGSVLITGGNGGLGRETARLLVANGYDRVVLACRSEDKGQEARADILATCGPHAAEVVSVAAGFDMTDPLAIRRAVDALSADQPFDVVFLQAGGVVYGNVRQTVSFNGVAIERTVFQNVVGGHFTLSRLLERGLVKSSARVVVAGGEGARGIPGMMAKPEFASRTELRRYVQGENTDTPYVDLDAMGASKLMAALWVRKMSEQVPDQVEVVWFSPGLTAGTNGLQGTHPIKRWMLENVGFPVMSALGWAQSPQQGAQKFVDCIAGRVGQNGDLIASPEGQTLGPLVDQSPMNHAFNDVGLREEFWSILGELQPA